MTERISQNINEKQNTFTNYNDDYQMPERYNSYRVVNLKNNHNIEENNNDINNTNINMHKKYSISRKNNMVNNQSNSFNTDRFVEQIIVFIDDNSFRNSEIIIQNHNCKFIFDNKVEKEFINLLHFTQKYFEFPIFYFFKGSYNDDLKITTITLKDYRSFKIKSSSNKIYKKLKDFANNTLDFCNFISFVLFVHYYKDI